METMYGSLGGEDRFEDDVQTLWNYLLISVNADFFSIMNFGLFRPKPENKSN